MIRDKNERSSVVDEPLLTLQQVAKLLAITGKAVSALVHQGELPFIAIGSGKVRPRMRFERRDVEEFIQRRKTRLLPPAQTSTLRIHRRGPAPVGFLEMREEMLRQKRERAAARKNKS